MSPAVQGGPYASDWGMAPLCSTGSAIIIHTASVLAFKGICYEQILMRYYRFIL